MPVVVANGLRPRVMLPNEVAHDRISRDQGDNPFERHDHDVLTKLLPEDGSVSMYPVTKDWGVLVLAGPRDAASFLAGLAWSAPVSLCRPFDAWDARRAARTRTGCRGASGTRIRTQLYFKCYCACRRTMSGTTKP